MLKGLLGSSVLGIMRKRQEARPAVSDRTMSVIEQARAKLNKASPGAPAPKPLATPSRSLTPPPRPEPKAGDTPPNVRTGDSAPTSVQTGASTPLKSPDLKRLKPSSELAGSIPSMPSFQSGTSSENPRHSDTATTLSLSEYAKNKLAGLVFGMIMTS